MTLIQHATVRTATRRSTRPGSVLRARLAVPLTLLLSLVALSPAGAAKTAAAAAATDRAAGRPRVQASPSITIVRRVGPAERAAREQAGRERRAAAGPRLAAWCRGYRAALRPLAAAAEETLRSLEVAWGPDSRNLGYQVAAAAAALRDAHLPAPDPDLDRQLQTALRHFEEGAAACGQGMPTTAQRWLGSGRSWLAAAERTLAVYAAEGWACTAGPAGPR